MKRLISPRRSGELKVALQTAAAGAAALYAATLLGLAYPFWSAISAIVVAQTSLGGGVLSVARDRAAGTITGAAAGAAVAFVRPPGLEGLVLALAGATAVLAFLSAGRPWLKIAPVTAAIVIAGGAGPEGPASLALDRVMEILVGSAAGVIAIMLLFPRHARQAFQMQAREAAGQAARLLDLVRRGDRRDAVEIRRLHNDVKRRLQTLEEVARNVIDLPGGQRETADRSALVRAFWRVRSDIVILGRGFQSEGAAQTLRPWSEAAALAAARLDALSRGQAGQPLGRPDPLLTPPSGGGDDMARGAAAIGLAHMFRDLDDLAARFKDLRLV